MATPTKTWFDSISNMLSPAAPFDQVQQYKEAFLALVNVFLAANWTVSLSTNGITAPTAANQILTLADVTIGNAAQPRSWIVFQSPAGWAVGGSVYVQLGTANASADTTPQTIRLRMATAAYTGGSTTTYPTGGTGDQDVQTGTSILSWNTTPIQGQWSAVWTADGDVYFFTKPLGVAFFTMMIAFRSSGAFTDGGRGNFRAIGLQSDAGVTSEVTLFTTILAAGTWKYFNSAGGAGAGSNLQVKTIYASAASNWNFGQESAERITQLQPFYIFGNGTTTSNRYLGRWTDVLSSCESSLRSGMLLKNETGPKRMLQFGSGLWFPVSEAGAQRGFI